MLKGMIHQLRAQDQCAHFTGEKSEKQGVNRLDKMYSTYIETGPELKN